VRIGSGGDANEHAIARDRERVVLFRSTTWLSKARRHIIVGHKDKEMLYLFEKYGLEVLPDAE